VSPAPVDPSILKLLQCPLSGSDLRQDHDALIASVGAHRYPITPVGIPLFADQWISRDGAVQRDHYDALAPKYLQNLSYPHTIEYMAYLDRSLLAALPPGPLGTVAEICCGTGEGLHLLGGRAAIGVGVDVSTKMLEAAVERTAHDPTRAFVQGDATRLPLKTGAFDAVIMLGGVHHVNNRPALFTEIARVLVPRGLFICREPIDDFPLWRVLRSVVYRTASSLQASTEHPLRLRASQEEMAEAGLLLSTWRTFGFLAYCFLMNSDVLPINRIWRHVPGVRPFTRAATKFDEWTLRLPGLRGYGLIAIGTAFKG
jgi:SAM-dependent methyltransferase